jgi:hypothetical protein
MTRHVGLGRSPVGPCRRNERSAAIRQNDENEQDAASLDGVDHTESLAFEGVAPPDNGHLRRNISVMGSVAPLPSTRFRMTICSSQWLVALRTVLCCG